MVARLAPAGVGSRGAVTLVVCRSISPSLANVPLAGAAWMSGSSFCGGSGPAVCRHAPIATHRRSEEHTSELQSRLHLVCRLLLEKKNKRPTQHAHDTQTCHY